MPLCSHDHKQRSFQLSISNLCKSVESRSMQYFNRKSIELEKNLVRAVKNFHNLDLWGVLRIETGESREIGWG